MNRCRHIRARLIKVLPFLVGIVGYLFLAIIPAMAQSPNQDPAINATLKHEVEEAVRLLLSRHIPDAEFQVDAVVVAKSSEKISMPYLPNRSTSRLPKGSGFDALKPYLDRVELKIFLSKRFNKAATANISKLLNAKLGLNAAKGDKIEFDTLNIDVIKQPSDVERDLLSAEARLRDAEKVIKSSEKERDEAKQQYVAAKTELDRNARQDLNHAKDTADPKTAINAPDFWREHGVVLGLGAASFVVLLLLGLFFLLGMRGLGGQVKESITAIAQALEASAGSINQAPALQGKDQPSTLKLDARESQANTLLRSSPSIPLDSLHARLLQLHEELLERVNDMTEAITLRHIDSLLSTPNLVAKAVSTMELLGREKANELFERLSPKAQEIVLEFLRNGFYDQPKGELMLEAGDELKTKLLAEAFDQGLMQPNQKLLGRIIKLADQDLASVVALLDEAAVPRFLRNLEPNRIASVLGCLKTLDARRFSRVVSGLHKISSAATLDSYDDDIAKALDEIAGKVEDDVERPYLKFYQAIIESADEQLADELIAGFGVSTRVKDYLGEHVVTISTFFKLSPDLKNEILDGVGNKDIAALLVSLPNDQWPAITDLLSERRRDLVTDEATRLSGKSARVASLAATKAKALLVSRMKQLKNEGTPLAVALPAATESGKQNSLASDDLKLAS